MENRNITFPQTKTILNGVNVPGVTLNDIQAVLNMRDAWRYLVSSMDVPVAVPEMTEVRKELTEILSSDETNTERGID